MIRERVVVPKSTASLRVLAQAALEMTAYCYVWLEPLRSGVQVVLEPIDPTQRGLKTLFDRELSRARLLETHSKKTDPLRAVLAARAWGPRGRPDPGSSVPSLDPETEAEIDRLLAEIESDDWLADAGEIAQTWEERFGSESEKKEQ